jgi:hypothetical protein
MHVGFSASFGDYDRDGYLDLFVCEWRANDEANGAPTNTRLLHNLGASSPGHFEDVTDRAGVSMQNLAADGVWAYSAAFADFDDDGWPDLAVTSDFQTSRLFWNRGDGTFEDGTEAAQVGTDDNGMGSTIGDWDGDGRLDWFITSIFDPNCGGGCVDLGSTGNRLYRNNGGRTFSDITDLAGVRQGSWGWGTAFWDYDNDRDLDIVMTNGFDFPYPRFAAFQNDPMLLWRNTGGIATEVARGAGITDTGSGKGLLVFDYDNDGDLDLFVVDNSAAPKLYRNDGGNANDWLRIRLRPGVAEPQPVGARITVVETDAAPARVSFYGSHTYFLGQSESIAHFGLGTGTAPVARVTIRWPRTGIEQTITNVARNQVLDVAPPEPSDASGDAAGE